ncbi:ABC transporter substrate-binding protein [Candidatus Pristimantibacillus sp. PTI5]|uniref:ABC transporter substrate-binding protein n=1 Tax=Candidatus Pristimantibacillus sp. PTI5 TaxID=3400422 RepID=UPI003B01E526
MQTKKQGAQWLIYMVIGLQIAALTGCASKEADNPADNETKASTVRLEFWTPFSGGDNQFMTEMVNRFNKENKEIEVVQVNSRLDDYYSRLKTAIMSGNAPDLAILHQTSLQQFVQNGYIEKLTEPAKQINLDWTGFNKNILDSTMYDGHSYAVPLDTHALVMYYNKSFLRQAGLLDADGNPLMSAGADGFAAFLQKLKASIPPNIAPMAQPSTRIDSVWLWWSLYNQINGGGTFYNEQGTEAVFNNPKALKALTFVDQLYKKQLIPPNINDAFKLFYDGEAAVLITGMWGTGAFEKATNLDFGVIPMPVLFDQPAVWGDSHTIAIPTRHAMTDERKRAALTFAKWCVEHGAMWAEAGHVPSMTKVVAGEPFNSLDYRSAYAATANYVAYWPRHVRQWSIVEILIQEFEKMNYSQQSPEQTLQAAVKRVNTELKK